MSVTVRPYRRGGCEVDIQWRSQDGRRHRERKRLDITSKTAAQRWGEGRERELLTRGPTHRRKEVPTLEQFAPRFMDGHARANQAKPSGIAHKELVLKNHLFPALGAKRLDEITDEDVQQLKYKLRHRKPRTVNNVLTVLSVMLKKAVEWRVIDHARCVVRLVKVHQGTARFYSFEEFEALLAVARRVSPVAELVVLIGGEAGLRAGEMRALQWADVDFTRRQLRVARSEWHGHLTATKGGRVRYVPLTRRLAAALEAAQRGTRKADEVLKRENGSPFGESHVADLLIKVAREAAMPPHGPHTLRHTFCSHLAMRGAAVGAIQALAGHQDLMTTQRYMHLSPNVLDAAIGLLDTPRDCEAPRGDIVETLAGALTTD